MRKRVVKKRKKLSLENCAKCMVARFGIQDIEDMSDKSLENLIRSEHKHLSNEEVILVRIQTRKMIPLRNGGKSLLRFDLLMNNEQIRG